MLIYSYKLDKYVRCILFPKLLLIPNKYNMKGSFRRKIPYVTDIDLVSNIYPEIDETNIYEKLVNLICQLKNEPTIILVYITCGTDNRFKIETGSEMELEKIKSLLNDNEASQFDFILKKYSNNFDKKIFFINEMIWDHYKLRWTPNEVLQNKKILPGDIIIKFTDIIKNNTTVLMQYFVKIESYPIGIDVVFNYKQVDLMASYQKAAEYQFKLANYSKEYYYMLFPFRYYFKGNQSLVNELDDLIEKKLGLYKQLMVRIDTYSILYNSNNLDIRIAKDIIISIIKDVNQLPDFDSTTIDQIRKVAINNSPEYKMQEWASLLIILYDEIDNAVNIVAKDYFFKYLELIPKNIRNKYYLIDEEQNRIN